MRDEMNKYLSVLVALSVLTSSAVYAVKEVVEESESKKVVRVVPTQNIPMSPFKKDTAISKLWDKKVAKKNKPYFFNGNTLFKITSKD
jgi:hypothetical protein